MSRPIPIMGRRHAESLQRVLRLYPRTGGAELCRLLGGINRSTLSRWIHALEGQVVSRGGSRRIRYALRRDLRGSTAPLPLYRIDEAGRGHEIGLLDLVHPEGSALSFLEPFPWPLDEDARDGWFDGLPYPVMDMRPQGFLGRNFAHRHASDLGVSDEPEAWSLPDIAHVLVSRGSDLPGNLILGETAYRRFLGGRHLAETRVLSEAQAEAAYPEMAAAALAHGIGASSAGGEFPKFLARRNLGGRMIDVIVKFSGSDGSPAVRRWADLLVCEHLALETVRRRLGIPAAESAILRSAGRTFLEVVRFDRHGESGRSAVCTLAGIDAALVGAGAAPWPRLARVLHDKGWLSPEDRERIERLWWFGRLIGNTDMHDSNLAFRPGLALAPVYDMLPMTYAPLRGGELPDRVYVPTPPLPGDVHAWRQAADAATHFWQACLTDPRIGPTFKRICSENALILERARASS